MILKLFRELFIQTSQGVVRKDIALVYDDSRKWFGVKFARALHPDLLNAVFWLEQDALIDVKRSGLMQYKRLIIQLPQGNGAKDVLIQYDDERGMFGFRILNAHNPELQKAVFWIREQDLVAVKSAGNASLVV